MKIVDHAGKRFGRLTVVAEDGKDGGHKKWRCRCDCGEIVVCRGTALTQGYTKSCGCFRKDFGQSKMTTHGLSKHPDFACWAGMMQRCYNEKDKHYMDYGGRGITVCDRWRDSPANFFADMGTRPSGLTIDRIEVDGNYEAGNCRWADMVVQSNNRRNSVRVIYAGNTMTIKELAEKVGLRYHQLHHQIRTKGLSPEDAIAFLR